MFCGLSIRSFLLYILRFAHHFEAFLAQSMHYGIHPQEVLYWHPDLISPAALSGADLPHKSFTICT